MVQAAAPVRESRSADAVDTHVGVQIRRLRRQRSVSQQALAASIGVTFQQVQKYEQGTNRVSASMLYRVCEALDCLVTDLMPETKNGAPALVDENLAIDGADHLLQAYAAMSSSSRRALLAVADAILGTASESA